MAPRRVLMIALDAFDLSLIDRLSAAGRLPNIAAFRAESHEFGVESMGASLHGSVWASFASGKGPGVHGVYFWSQWLAEQQTHVRNKHPEFAYEPFWAGFPAQGKRLLAIDLPYVGFVHGPGMRTVMGWGSQEESVHASEPPTLLGELNRRFGRNPLSFDLIEPLTSKQRLQLARRLRKGVRMRAAMLEQIAAERDWDLCIVNVSETHMGGHYLSGSEPLSAKTTPDSAMGAVLRPLDEALPRIVAAAGPDCDICLFTAHGMQPQYDFSYFGRQIADLMAGREPVDTDAHPDLLRRIRGMIPGPVHRAIWRRLPEKFRAARQGSLSVGHADTSADDLFTIVHDTSAAFRLNLAGRERDGTLTPEQGEERIAALEKVMAGLTADNGLPAFGPVRRPQREWPGPRAHRLPDALANPGAGVISTAAIVTADGQRLSSTHPPARNGAHTDFGFCFYRPAGEFTPRRSSADIRDFAPTVLGRLGVAAPDGLEGTPFAT